MRKTGKLIINSKGIGINYLNTCQREKEKYNVNISSKPPEGKRLELQKKKEQASINTA